MRLSICSYVTLILPPLGFRNGVSWIFLCNKKLWDLLRIGPYLLVNRKYQNNGATLQTRLRLSLPIPSCSLQYQAFGLGCKWGGPRWYKTSETILYSKILKWRSVISFTKTLWTPLAILIQIKKKYMSFRSRFCLCNFFWQDLLIVPSTPFSTKIGEYLPFLC